MEPKVSIIIPVFNIERYLRQCLDSVVNQSYSNLDILIIDDGSTDSSGQICDEYAELDNRITVFHTNNKGLSAARNCGLDHCKGEYVAFIDGDDWMEANEIELLLHDIMSESADIAVCNHYIEWKNYQDIESKTDSLRLSQGDDIVRDYLHGRGIGVQVWSKLYRTRLFTQIRFPEGRIHEDIATTYKLLDVSEKLVRLALPLHHYRMRKNSLSKTHTLKSITDLWISCYETYNALIDRYEDCRMELTSACLCAIGRFWIWYYGCSKEEITRSTIVKMQEFAKEHENEVFKDSNYSIIVRFSCFLSKTSNFVIFGAIYYANRIYQICRSTDLKRMFD